MTGRPATSVGDPEIDGVSEDTAEDDVLTLGDGTVATLLEGDEQAHRTETTTRARTPIRVMSSRARSRD
jgi:hypothetical protein